MVKQFLSFLLVLLVIQPLATIQTFQGDFNTIPHSYESKENKKISYEVKKSGVFQDYVKNLSSESQVELEKFLVLTEQSITNNHELKELISQYQDLFSSLNIDKKSSKVVITFSFDKEKWLDLVTIDELDLDPLKNKISQNELNHINSYLLSLARSLEKIEKGIFTELITSHVYNAIKEKCGNQLIRIGLVLV